jgi:hypothetical protein
VLPHDLIDTAVYLVSSSAGKPRQAHLRRAISTTYYAMFHTLARCCADLLIGGSGSNRSKKAWSQVYRAVDHGFAKSACGNNQVLQRFPQAIQDFANMFVQMQIKRHDADYNPDYRAYKSAVITDIFIANAIIHHFNRVPLKDRRAFAAHAIIKHRTV